MMSENVVDCTLFFMVTACGIIGALIPVMVKTVIQIFLRESEMEANLRRQGCDLKAELGGINMVDEFAKYAKIQRKLNKVTDEIAHQSRLRTSYNLKVRLVVTAALYAIMCLTVVLLMWKYSSIAIVTLPEHWVYPLGNIIAFPSNVKGGIGLSTWFVVSGQVGRVLANSLS